MWLDIKGQLDSIYCALADDESKEWFDAKVKFMIDDNKDDFITSIEKIRSRFPQKWRNVDLERALSDGQDIIIYGCGCDGKNIKRNLEMAGYTIKCWCDSDIKLHNQVVDGKKVISPEELGEKHSSSLV